MPQSQAQFVSVVMTSPLLDAYLRQVGLGSMSCHQLGMFCSKGERPRPRIYEELSKCIGHNAERDLHLWVDAQEFMGVLPPLYSFRVEKFRGANPDVEPTEQTHSALLPHEVFASLGQRSPELFAHLMAGPLGISIPGGKERPRPRRVPRAAGWPRPGLPPGTRS